MMSPSLRSPLPRKKWLNPTSYNVAAEANVEMWPPMPSSSLFALTTIASAFQRTRLSMRRSISRLDEGAGINAGSGMALEIDDVAVVAIALAAEEVVEPDLVQRGGGGERRNVAADAFLELVRLDDHRQRVPADEALDAALDLAATGKRRLLAGGDGIDVRGVRREGLLDVVASGVIAEFAKEAADSCGAAGLKHVIERLQPLPCFEGFDLRCVLGGCIAHESSTAARADQ